MLLSKRVRLIRSIAASLVNGIITLIILLIAPLGLLAVITNTILVLVSTFLVFSLSDVVLIWMFGGQQPRGINSRQGMVSNWIQNQMTDRTKDD